MTGQYLLHYFTDKTRRRHKGTIPLSECDQVDSGLSIENGKQKYDYMFNIKTPRRIYYLAVDSPDEMTTWVRLVCTACGLRASPDDEENHADKRIERTLSNNTDTPSISSPYILISDCISGPLPSSSSSSYANMNHSTRSQKNSLSKLEDASSYEESDDSVFEPPLPQTSSNAFLPPSRPPKPAHLANRPSELTKSCHNVSSWLSSSSPPFISRDLKPGRKLEVSDQDSKSMTMGPPVQRTLKPNNFSATTPRKWTVRHNSVTEDGNHPDSRSRSNSAREEQIYYYIPRLDSSGGQYPPMMIPAESFENQAISYIDLELPNSNNVSKPGHSTPSTTVYKTVDFIKTDAFNRTRENVQAKYDDAQQQV